MGHHHHDHCGHDHHGHANHEFTHLGKVPFFVLMALTAIGASIEIWGGVVGTSLSLNTDAVHLIADGFLYWLMFKEDSLHKEGNATSFEKTRIEKHAGAFLAGIGSVLTFTGFFSILFGGHHVIADEMLWPTIIGLIINLAMAVILYLMRVTQKHQNRAALWAGFWHNVGDTVSSVGVLAVVLLTTYEQYPPIAYFEPIIGYLDPIVGTLIGWALCKMGLDLYRGKAHVH